ncbi:MAG: hypothetical protein K8T91_05060, partial [Planctomycetes bacterium]|nr:hypothetical protein [Planctomycetota bacterium]
MDDVSQFIRSFGDADENRIAFAWNGKHGEHFSDANYEFRKAVLESVCAAISAAPLPLVRDLFRAETEFSREAWCIDLRVRKLAETMLMRGGTECLMPFLIGKHQSFDASLACASIQIAPQLATSLLMEVNRLLASHPNEFDERLLT